MEDAENTNVEFDTDEYVVLTKTKTFRMDRHLIGLCQSDLPYKTRVVLLKKILDCDLKSAVEIERKHRNKQGRLDGVVLP